LNSELDSLGLSKYCAKQMSPGFQGRHDSFTEAAFKLLFGHIRFSFRNICWIGALLLADHLWHNTRTKRGYGFCKGFCKQATAEKALARMRA